MAGRTPTYCFDCKSNVRGDLAQHMLTRRHRQATRPPKPRRRSRLSYAYREGGMPSWLLAQNREPFDFEE